MTTVIVSDTHLTSYFHRRKYTFLRSIIASADRVILNGDFWESYVTTFDQFVNSPWRQLFPLLKERQTIYVYGNHDPKQASDDRVNLFSVQQADKWTLPIKHFSSVNREVSELVVRHGHRIVPHVDSQLKRIVANRYVTPLGIAGEMALTKAFGRPFLRLFKGDNKRAKQWAHSNLNSNQILVTGHNHMAEFAPEQQYICTGFVRYGLATYLTIQNGQMELIETRY